MKDNQIAYIFKGIKMPRRLMAIQKKGKRIPIYEEIDLSKPIWLDDIPKSAILTNKGGKKYLVYNSRNN